jgi:hypothetical protein
MTESSERPVMVRSKIIGYIAAWILALFATDPTLKLWPLAWTFPLGLYGFFYPPDTKGGGRAIFFGCILVYIIQAFLYFRARTKRSTVLWYAVLVILLICNISGCRAML